MRGGIIDSGVPQEDGVAGGGLAERVGNILYRICRAVAIITALVGLYYTVWAPTNQLVTFALFGGPALAVWSLGKLIRFLLRQF
jgi:hypothetical protein